MKTKEECVGALTEKLLIQAGEREVGKSQVRTTPMLTGWRVRRSHSPIEDFSFPFFSECGNWLSTRLNSLLVDAVSSESWLKAEVFLVTCELSLFSGSWLN